MRRRRSRRAPIGRALLSGAAALLAVALSARSAMAQESAAPEGALYLLMPVGARAVALGNAVVADTPGSEAVWWNPAGLAHQEKREVAVHHSQTVFATGDALSLVVPSSLLGVLAASVNILKLDESPATDRDGNEIGTLVTRSFVYAATYSTPIGDRVNAGLSYKYIRFQVACSGLCTDIEEISSSTPALDVGAQFAPSASSPISVGVAVRNVGLRLQVKDNPQADPLPTRIQVGAAYRVPLPAAYADDTELKLAADLTDQLRFERPATHVGVDLEWQKKVSLRAGYAAQSASRLNGPAIGFGLVTGGLIIDFARVFDDISSGAGQPPTYLSLHYVF